MTKLCKIIALCGYKRSGKDTVAQYLSQTYGYCHLKISDPLKSVVKVLFDFSNDQVETDLKDLVDLRWGISPRMAMQFIGTEVMQHKIQDLLPDIGKTFWVHKIMDAIQHTQGPVVISDLRFLHEYEELQKKYPIHVIRIERPSLQEICTHISEQEYKRIPYHTRIINNGSLASLYDHLNQIELHDVH